MHCRRQSPSSDTGSYLLFSDTLQQIKKALYIQSIGLAHIQQGVECLDSIAIEEDRARVPRDLARHIVRE